MGKLAGKVALVTGGGRGIGHALVLKLAREGARIVINDLDEAPAAETAKAVAEMGGEAVTLVGSVTEPDFGERFVGKAVEAFGNVHILVNNAGYTWDNVVQKMSDEQFQTMMDVHLGAPFRILRAAQPIIRAAVEREAAEQREVYRKIVNISSLAGLYGNAGQIGYSTAKAGIVGMTRTLCKEWGRYKVNVNCVAFGFIETRLTQPLGAERATIEVEGREIAVGVQPQMLQMVRQTVPLGRAGTPKEAADAIYLLCSPESDYISGQVLVCGGGLLI
ncbi:MAG TPA: SDR family oxidoreductase [Caulobacteraceae bacterium]|nr:SDR family oxidoreductase [Caulobacteraceae bacterium]